MKKRIISILAAGALLLSSLGFSGCTVTSSDYNAMQDYDFSSINLVQLEMPDPGDTIAIFDTDLGEFRAVLYDEYCPKTVAKFVERVNAGDYNNKSVYYVINDAYLMTGGFENDKGAYTGRKDDTEVVENEYSVDLWPFKGALVAYSELPGYSDSRLIICNEDKTITQEQVDELKESMYANDKYDDVQKANIANLFDKFIEVGGVFAMGGYVTVFGQTYEGMDVVDKITSVQTDEKTYRPLETIMVKSVTISTYEAESEQ